MANDFPPTNKWEIYSLQKNIPHMESLAEAGAVHNYLVLVDAGGNIVREMHGVPQKGFTFGTTPGNYLNVQMWVPNEYMYKQQILNSGNPISRYNHDDIVICALHDVDFTQNEISLSI